MRLKLKIATAIICLFFVCKNETYGYWEDTFVWREQMILLISFKIGHRISFGMSL